MAIAQESQIRAEQAQTSLKVEATFIRPGLSIPSFPKALVGPNMPFSQYLSIHEPGADQGTNVSLYAAKEPEADAKAFQKRVGRSVGIKEQMRRITLQLQRLDIDTSQLAANGQVRKQNEKNKADLRKSLLKQMDRLRDKLLTNDFNDLGSTSVAPGFDPAGWKVGEWMKGQIDKNGSEQGLPIKNELPVGVALATAPAIALYTEGKKLKNKKKKEDERRSFKRNSLAAVALSLLGFGGNILAGNPVGQIFRPTVVQAASSEGMDPNVYAIPNNPNQMVADPGGGGGGHIYPPPTGTPPPTDKPQPTATTEATKVPPATATAKPPTQEPTKVAELNEEEELKIFLKKPEIVKYLNNYSVEENLDLTTLQESLPNTALIHPYTSNSIEFLVDPTTQVPLFAKDKNGWRIIGEKDLAQLLGLENGDSLVYKKSDNTIVGSSNYHEMIANNYSVVTIAQGLYWKWFERSKDSAIDSYSKNDVATQIAIIKNMKLTNPNLKVRVHAFGSFPETNPNWLAGLSKDEAKNQIKEHMQQVYDLFTKRGVVPDEYVVVNEPFFQGDGWTRPDSLQQILGDEYLPYMFSTAREIVGDKALLIYNDTANNSQQQSIYNTYTGLTKENIQKIKTAGVQNFAVGLQMHLDATTPIDEGDLLATMQGYGVPVVITELDVDTSSISPDQKAATLAKIYSSVFRAAINSGVCQGISTWNGVDDLSNDVDYDHKNDASPTLFKNSSDPLPKLAYFELMKLLYSYLQQVTLS